MPFKCSNCDKLFSTKFNLNKHLRAVHNSDPEIIKNDSETKYYCENCASYFKFNNELRKHLETQHGFNNVREELTFQSFKDFSDWLCEEESKNNLQYVKNAGKKGSTYGYIKTYYECRRSYRRKKLPENRQRKRKSCKMAKSCTSQIILNRNIKSDECFVVYYKSHYLHDDNEIEYLQLSKQDKESIVDKLVNGMSPKDILYSTRNAISSDLKRMDLLELKDIQNIKKSYKIGDSTTKKVSDDNNNHHQIKENIKTNFDKTLNNIDKLNTDQLNTILQYSNMCLILSENQLIDKNKKRFDIISDVVKQIKQETFFSTQKNITKNKLPKLSHNESKILNNDHQYMKVTD